MPPDQPRQSYLIRNATIEDVPALTTLINLSVHALHVSVYSPEVITAALKSVYGVDTTLISDGHYFAVSPASDPLKIIASGGWSNRTTLYGGDQFSSRNPTRLDPTKDAAKIRAMFVHPDWTRKGIGKFLIEACEAAAKKKGFSKVELGATLSGAPFYESMGYTLIETFQWGLGDGLSMEIRKMTKDFNKEM